MATAAHTENGATARSADPQDTDASPPNAEDQGSTTATTTLPDVISHPFHPARNDVVAEEQVFTTSSSTSEDTPDSDMSPVASGKRSDVAEMMTLQRMTAESTVPEALLTSSVRTEKPKRTKRRVRGNTTCGVCGDRAIAHNFGALSCETCKAFFRRNATKKQDIPPCLFNKACVITKTTRRFCASCRMEKCFAIGMDSLLILDEEEKKAMRARRRENRKQREVCMKVDSSTPSVSVPLDGSSIAWHQLTVADYPFSSAECLQLYSDVSPLGLASFLAAENGSSSDSNANPVYMAGTFEDAGVNSSAKYDSNVSQSTTSVSQSTTEVTKTNCPSQMFGAFLAQGRRFRHVEREQLSWDIKLYWLLSEKERSVLTRLTTSYTTIQTALQTPSPSDNFRPDQPLCVDNLMFILEATLRKSVQFAKTIPDFRNLSEADQIAILKASALETYALRSAALFIVEKDAWNSYLGHLHIKDVQKVCDDHTSVDVFAKFCAALKSVAKANSSIYALLHCIVLFGVRNTKLEEVGKVNAVQDKYFVLLKHYLESEYSYLHASRYMAELMALLEDMHKLHHKIAFFYKQFSSFFRPLITEFFTA